MAGELGLRYARQSRRVAGCEGDGRYSLLCGGVSSGGAVGREAERVSSGRRVQKGLGGG